MQGSLVEARLLLLNKITNASSTRDLYTQVLSYHLHLYHLHHKGPLHPGTFTSSSPIDVNNLGATSVQAEVALASYEEVANAAAGEGVDLVTKVIV